MLRDLCLSKLMVEKLCETRQSEREARRRSYLRRGRQVDALTTYRAIYAYQYMESMPPGIAGAAGEGSFLSETTASVVRTVDAMDAAF